MNSSIACLSNCTELTTYFLTEKYKQSINKSNKLGLGGKLAKAWYNLLTEYWNSKTGAVILLLVRMAHGLLTI